MGQNIEQLEATLEEKDVIIDGLRKQNMHIKQELSEARLDCIFALVAIIFLDGVLLGILMGRG